MRNKRRDKGSGLGFYKVWHTYYCYLPGTRYLHSDSEIQMCGGLGIRVWGQEEIMRLLGLEMRGVSGLCVWRQGGFWGSQLQWSRIFFLIIAMT